MVTAQSLQDLFFTMQVRQNIVDKEGKILLANIPTIVNNICARIQAHKDTYQQISGHYPSEGFKWFIPAIIHYMEGNLDFSKYLGNGQSLNKKTTIVPKGRGPFNSFVDGAIDALDYQHVNSYNDWSIGGTLYFLEGYNGFGYDQYHNEASPYLFSGSDKYTTGKYTSDGKFDINAVSTQIGAALLLKRLLEINQL